jgi:glycosyltransferase involved in cell wall biosynthesis
VLYTKNLQVPTVFDFSGVRIVLVGPLPPPSGGMANQTEQLARLLAAENARVDVVRTNAPYRPAWIGRVRFVRSLFRLIPYRARLGDVIPGASLVHVMANSGWAWHLFAAPAIRAAHRAGVPAVVNYRGGDAERFFARSFARVERALELSCSVVVPSTFLKGVFEKYGVSVDVVPNVVDVDRFRPTVPKATNGSGPRILIARNLESIYDVETGIRAFQRLRESIPGAFLDIAGTGPEAHRLRKLTAELGLGSSVRFLGRIDNAEMPATYRSADLALNTSLVDNMPISILEALASGVPVVSTRVGGVPHLVEDGKQAVLVPPGDPEAMAKALVSLWRSPERRDALREAGLARAKAFAWSSVRDQWARVYRDAVSR